MNMKTIFPPRSPEALRLLRDSIGAMQPCTFKAGTESQCKEEKMIQYQLIFNQMYFINGFLQQRGRGSFVHVMLDKASCPTS